MKVVKSLIFILFALCSLSGKAQEVAADSTGYIVRVGEMAPNFTITLTDGKKVTLSELRGDVTVHCQLVWGMPQRDAFHRKRYLAETQR